MRRDPARERNLRKVLTNEIAARLAHRVAPDLTGEVWVAWEREAIRLRGEDHELAAMLSQLLQSRRISEPELADLGATEHQIALAAHYTLDKLTTQLSACVVLRRHAEPGSIESISQEGLLAATSLASGGTFDNVRCGPSARTSRTARAWASAPTTDVRFALPPQFAEHAVGVHASFSAWRNSIDDQTNSYCKAMATAVQGLSWHRSRVLVITHDGVPQATIAGLSIAPTQPWRDQSLSHLEGIVVRFDAESGTRVCRVRAPPITLLD